MVAVQHLAGIALFSWLLLILCVYELTTRRQLWFTVRSSSLSRMCLCKRSTGRSHHRAVRAIISLGKQIPLFQRSFLHLKGPSYRFSSNQSASSHKETHSTLTLSMLLWASLDSAWFWIVILTYLSILSCLSTSWEVSPPGPEDTTASPSVSAECSLEPSALNKIKCRYYCI